VEELDWTAPRVLWWEHAVEKFGQVAGSMRAAIEDVRSSGSTLAGSQQQQPVKEIDRITSRAGWQEPESKLD